MFSAIYIEEEVAGFARVEALLARFPDIPQIQCERYGEIFNRKAQNFRLQKRNPALILAKKYGNLVLPAPIGYGFNSNQSYYFSHMLNCVYDCRYCFLQGMYRSANTVLFVNYEDFVESIRENIAVESAATVFYSGYDCDSLALEPVSAFTEYFVPFFSSEQNAVLELRTKSTQIRNLLNSEPSPNVVIAMSFTLAAVADKWEHKVPSVEKRLLALKRLQDHGWPVALRFEPLISPPGATMVAFEDFFRDVFSRLEPEKLHSVSTGMFRMPQEFYKNILTLYPDEELFARKISVEDGMVYLSAGDEAEVLDSVKQTLFQFISPRQYYHCTL
ncbi:MAG: DNA photolyase [Gammaproteobacteria bacterium]|jgi:spore photoproduct lyase|nr:DNA photolyase [Gammaproteobacteria bacterium]|tara:strand:+ start:332 stop:1324 length:993 start_codon:yes stop_codon:yes gene_type:complete